MAENPLVRRTKANTGLIFFKGILFDKTALQKVVELLRINFVTTAPFNRSIISSIYEISSRKLYVFIGTSASKPTLLLLLCN